MDNDNKLRRGHGQQFDIVYIDCRPSTLKLINKLGLNKGFDGLHIHVGQPAGSELLSLMKNARVILTGRTELGKDVLTHCRQLKNIVFSRYRCRILYRCTDRTTPWH